MIITFDIIFSNWIFIWFLLFYFNLIKYNPFFIFILVFSICNLYLIYAYYYKILNNYNISKIFVLSFLFKFIPIIILILTKNNKFTVNDVLFSIVFFILYLIYLHINNTNMIYIYNKLFEGFVSDDDNCKGQGSKLYDYIYKEYFL